jgi:hypothetical protein
MSRFLDVLTGDVLTGGERDRDELDARLPAGDPLAIFHRLEREAAPAAASDVSAMKAAVAELRRARELSRRSDEITGEFPVSAFAAVRSPEQPRLAPPARRAAAWRLPAAAAALLATLVFFGGPGVPGPGAAVASSSSATASPAPAAAAPAPLFGEAAAASYLPLVEDLDPRQAEMIQIEDEGVSLVVVLAAGSV